MCKRDPRCLSFRVDFVLSLLVANSVVRARQIHRGFSSECVMTTLDASFQILGRPGFAKVEVDGHGTIEAPAILLSQTQARHLATQIIELLGPEN